MKKSIYKQPRACFLASNPFPYPRTLGFFYREKMRAIYNISPDLPFQSILELGGGKGGLTSLLYPNSKIINLDLEPRFAHAACNQKSNVTFVVGDATCLPFLRNTFDAVTMFDVLEHILDDHTAIAEAVRVLKPGGYLLISTPDRSVWRFPSYRFLVSMCPSENEVMAEWGHVRRGYMLDELKALIPIPFREHSTFINRTTALNHDIAFSKLPTAVKLFISCLLLPITWLGYLSHRSTHSGAEHASCWLKQELPTG